jgi:hypothetical protein
LATEFALPEGTEAAVIVTSVLGVVGMGNSFANHDTVAAGLAYGGREAGMAEGFFKGGALRLAKFVSIGALAISTARDAAQAKSDYESCIAGK